MIPRDEPEVIACRLRGRVMNLDLNGPLELKGPVYGGTVIQLWRNGEIVGRSTLTAQGGAIAGDTINLRGGEQGNSFIVSVKVIR